MDYNTDVAEIDQSTVLGWVKDHKNELIAAGLCITTLVGIILGITHKEELLEVWKNLQRTVNANTHHTKRITTQTAQAVSGASEQIEKAVSSTRGHPREHYVNAHVRKLPIGQKASKKKLEEAKTLGYELLDGQTIVSGHPRGKKAA